MAHDRLRCFHFRCRWLTLVVLAATLCSARGAEAQRPKSGEDVKSQKEVLEEEYGTLLSLLDRYRAADATVLPEIGLYWYRLYTTDRETIPVVMQRLPIAIAPLVEMSLTELGIAGLQDGQIKLANKHFETAERLMHLKLRKPTALMEPSNDLARERQLRFAIDWYKAIIWLRFARWELTEAKTIIGRARDRFPDDPDILLSAGTYEELGITRGRVEKDGNRRGQTLRPGEHAAESERQQRAIGFFRDAIRLDPNAAEARIRLAFMFTVLGDSRREETVTLLKEARAIESKPPLGYLAALFAGNVEEERKQTEAASIWYRTAIADCPHAQTARLAFSHLQLDQYDNMRPAQNTLRPLMGGPSGKRDGCEPDPWRLYDFGQAWRLNDHLDTMRKMVRESPDKS